jgi:hypothetical protein
MQEVCAMFSLFVSIAFIVLSAIAPAPTPAQTILYDDGSAIFVNCNVNHLAQTIVRIIRVDPSAIFDNGTDSPLFNALSSWADQCSWRVIGPDGLGLGAIALVASKRRVRRIWLANPTPECGQYNLCAFPSKRDAIAYVADCLRDDDPPRDEFTGRFIAYAPIEGVHYWPITGADVPPEDWAEYLDECASY